MKCTIASACRSAVVAAVLGTALLQLSGCAVFVQALAAAHPQTTPAEYKGLANQTVAVVVWAQDSGIRNEWSRIQYDTAQKILAKLQQTQAEDKPDELKGARFPLSAGSVVRFQEDDPDFAAAPIENIAPKLGVSRVIYVEITSFQTRSDVSDDLFLGKLTGSVTVVEVTNKIGRRVYTNDSMKISYPKSSPQEGLPNLGDLAVYNGTLDGFTTEVAKMFVTHGEDPDAPYTFASRATQQQQQ